MEESRMKKHVTVVGAIRLELVLSVFIGALTVFFAWILQKGLVGDDDVPTVVLGFLSVSLPILIGFMATLSLVGGIALFIVQELGQDSCHDCLRNRLFIYSNWYTCWGIFNLDSYAGRYHKIIQATTIEIKFDLSEGKKINNCGLLIGDCRLMNAIRNPKSEFRIRNFLKYYTKLEVEFLLYSTSFLWQTAYIMSDDNKIIFLNVPCGEGISTSQAGA